MPVARSVAPPGRPDDRDDGLGPGPDIDRWIDGRRLEGSLVTANFFRVLGVSAAPGRTLTPSDDELGGRQAIVLSHRA